MKVCMLFLFNLVSVDTNQTENWVYPFGASDFRSMVRALIAESMARVVAKVAVVRRDWRRLGLMVVSIFFLWKDR